MITITMPVWFAWFMAAGLIIVVGLWVETVRQGRLDLKYRKKLIEEMRKESARTEGEA